MHELSLVEALIEQVEQEVRRSGQGGRVIGVELVIGRLSGVNTDCLRFAFETLAPGTLVETAEVQVTEPKATCRCRACGTGTEVDGLVAQCPACGSGDVFLAGGRDLLLQSIHLED